MAKLYCLLCNKQTSKRNGIYNMNGYLCKECYEEFTSRRIYITFGHESYELRRFKEYLAQNAEKYSDIFQPDIIAGELFLDTKNGLFACGKDFTPHKDPVFSFSEGFLMTPPFLCKPGYSGPSYIKTPFGYKLKGCFNMMVINRSKDFRIEVPFTNIMTLKAAYIQYLQHPMFSSDPQELEWKDFTVHEIPWDYVPVIGEVVHQYFRHADEKIFEDDYEQEVSSMSGEMSTCAQWLFCDGKLRYVSYTVMLPRYLMLCSRFDRSQNADDKEKLACMRLDRVFAWSLCFCCESYELGAHRIVKYGISGDDEIMFKRFYDMLTSWWDEGGNDVQALTGKIADYFTLPKSAQKRVKKNLKKLKRCMNPLDH